MVYIDDFKLYEMKIDKIINEIRNEMEIEKQNIVKIFKRNNEITIYFDILLLKEIEITMKYVYIEDKIKELSIISI